MVIGRSLSYNSPHSKINRLVLPSGPPKIVTSYAWWPNHDSQLTICRKGSIKPKQYTQALGLEPPRLGHRLGYVNSR